MQVTPGRRIRVFDQAGTPGDTAAVRAESGFSSFCSLAIRWKMVPAVLIVWPVMFAGQQGSSIFLRSASQRPGVPPRVAQADGELLGPTPLEVTVEPLAAQLLVPWRD